MAFNVTEKTSQIRRLFPGFKISWFIDVDSTICYVRSPENTHFFEYKDAKKVLQLDDDSISGVTNQGDTLVIKYKEECATS